MRWLLGCAVAVGLMSGAASASATTITLVVTGELTLADDSNSVTDGSLVVGASYTATLVYDLAAAFDRDPDPLFGDWVVPAASSSVTVTVGNYTFDASQALVFGVVNGYYDPSEDNVGWLVLGLTGSGFLDPGVSWGTGYTDGSLYDYTGTALSSDVLASANWDVSDYQPGTQDFNLFIEVLDPRTTVRDYVELSGTIDTITVLLPEPGTLALLVAALLPALRRALR